MANRFWVSTDVLEWVFGRGPADGGPDPFKVQEVSEDGSVVWIGTERDDPLPGIAVVKYTPHDVPIANRDRALALRAILLNPPDDPEGVLNLIGFASDGSRELSLWSKPERFPAGEAPEYEPSGAPRVIVPRRFKKRIRKSR